MNAEALQSRNVSAKPRPRPRLPKNIPTDDEIVIDLTGYDDSPPKKRKRVIEPALFLESPKAGPSKEPSFYLAGFDDDDIEYTWDEQSSAGVSAIAGPSNTQERVLQDSTNTSERHDAPEPLPTEETNKTIDPFDEYLSHVLEVIPDVDPAHARKLLETHIPSFQNNAVQAVIEVLFDDPSYPKLEKKVAKRKRDEPEGEKSSVTEPEDYGKVNREFESDLNYRERSLDQLFTDFALIPKTYIRNKFFELNGLYAPTHLFLLDGQKTRTHTYKQLLSARPISSKGKGKARVPGISDEFNHERAWLLEKLSKEVITRNEATQTQEENRLEFVSETADGNGEIECGCCFGDFGFNQMVQCPDAHLFCQTCVTKYVSDRLGQHQIRLECMDQSNCKLLFPDSELARVLPEKLLSLYHRLKQMKEIEEADLEGLEECPFCDYKVVIDNPNEKLFRCENGDCMAVSCRACKKHDHLPRSCQEMEEDKHLDARHAVEEAMTNALMRNCPKCRKPFVKDAGCNKMTCPHCRTLSCYICRNIITGYQHFDPGPPHTKVRDPSKCPLWDQVEQRHDAEVAAAAQKAIEEARKANPDIDEKQIAVELPKYAATATARHGQQMPLNGIGQFEAHGQQMPLAGMGHFGAYHGIEDFRAFQHLHALQAGHRQNPLHDPVRMGQIQQDMAARHAALAEQLRQRDYERLMDARERIGRHAQPPLPALQPQNQHIQRVDDFNRRLEAMVVAARGRVPPHLQAQPPVGNPPPQPPAAIAPVPRGPYWRHR